MKALLGKKIGMTQVYSSETGAAIPVTILDVSNNVVAKHLKLDENVTHIELGKDTKKHTRKSEVGNYKEINRVPRFKKVIKLEKGAESIEINTELKADTFSEGDMVSVAGVTKGKGFQGGMKRWNFVGGKRTHGQSDRLRAPGSIGSGTTLGRVYKGQKMAGRMGRVNRTIKNLKVVYIDVENNLIGVAGSVPGNKNSYVVIKSK